MSIDTYKLTSIGSKPVILYMFYLSKEGEQLAVQHPEIPLEAVSCIQAVTLEKYPVLRFDFSTYNLTSIAKLDEYIDNTLADYEKQYGLTANGASTSSRMTAIRERFQDVFGPTSNCWPRHAARPTTRRWPKS